MANGAFRPYPSGMRTLGTVRGSGILVLRSLDVVAAFKRANEERVERARKLRARGVVMITTPEKGKNGD